MRPAALTVVLAIAAFSVALLPATAAVAGAGVWDPPIPVSDPGGSPYAAEVISDGTTITAAWQSSDGSFYRILTSSSTDDGLTWSAPAVLSAAGGHSFWPQLVSTGGAIVVVWSGTEGGEELIRSSRSVDGGLTWSGSVAISSAGGAAVRPQIVSNGSIITAIWTRSDGANDLVQGASSTDGGLTWSTPATISAAGEYAYAPSLVTDGTRVSVVWNAPVVRFATSLDGGISWTAPVALSGANIGLPKLTTGGGVLTAAWYMYSGADYSVHATSSSDGGATWTAPTQLSDPSAGAYDPELTSDGTTITVIWIAARTSDQRIESARSTDGGATWSAPTGLDGFQPAAFQHALSDDGTTLTATWVSFDGVSSRLLTAFSADRGLAWSAPVVVSGSLPSPFIPQMVDGGATTTIVWLDQFLQRIYASSFTQAGPPPPAPGAVAALLPPTGSSGALGTTAFALALLAGGIAVIARNRSRRAGIPVS